MGIAVGIDLGTTNSAVARLDEHGRPVLVPNGHGKPLTSSVICFRDGEVIVGEEAKELQQLATYPVAAFFKREMGSPHWIFEAEGVDYTPVDLSAIVLRKLKADAEAHLDETIRDAVITVPAYFKDPHRNATIEAGRMAGLNVLQVINEPTAAAVAYGFDKSTDPQRLLVYDLGGGTFDVTLLEIGGGTIRVRHSAGDDELGGKDWDDRIVEYLGERFEDIHGTNPLDDAESLADLLVLAEQGKKQLSETRKTRIAIRHGLDLERIELDRPAFEDITSDLMDRTISLTAMVLEDQGLAPGDVDGVLLVGGSTRMPMVREYVTRHFGKPPRGGVNPDEAVAAGAALVAHDHAQRRQPPGAGKPAFTLGNRIVDVTNHSMGMIALNDDRSAYVNSLILPKNEAIPCTQTRPYQHATRAHGSNDLEIYMTQGESTSPGQVTYLGRYLLHDVPHRDGVTVVDISYEYDLSGTVQVSGKDRVSGQQLQLEVGELPGDVPGRFQRPPELATEVEHTTAYLTIDVSGSMDGAPLEDAQEAAKSFVENTDLGHCSVGVVLFATHTAVKHRASQDARAIRSAIDAITCGETGYGTNHPFDEIEEAFRGVEGLKFAVILTDGSWSDTQTSERRAAECRDQGIEIITIGFGGAVKDFLDRIASSDEASFFTTQGGLVETFSSIAQVITESGGGLAAPGQAGSGRSIFSKFLGR